MAFALYSIEHPGHYPETLVELAGREKFRPEMTACASSVQTPATLSTPTATSTADDINEAVEDYGDGANFLHGNGTLEFIATGRAVALICAAPGPRSPVARDSRRNPFLIAN